MKLIAKRTLRRVLLLSLSLVWLIPSLATARDLPSSHFELKFATYSPKISNNQAKADFYSLMYGADTKPLMTSFAAHWYPSTRWGLIGGGFRMGMWKVDGAARLCADGESFTDCNSTTVFDSTEGNSQTRLTVIPISLEGVYRADYLHRYHGVPFEAYVKIGLDYHLWWATTEGSVAERTVDDKTTRGEGGTPGYHASVGLMLNLDWLDPKTAARGRAASSMAGTYLFAEWTMVQGDGFKQGKRLDMSADQLYVGLAVDFL